MVLVAPRPLLRPAPPGVAPADRGSGREVLALLRGDTAARPRFDPELAGGLRAWLEDAAYDVVATRGEHAPPLFLGPSQLLGSPAGWRDDEGLSDELILSRLAHALFRQLVHEGELGDPLCDALDALRASGAEALVGHVESLPAAARAALSEMMASHAANMKEMVPPVRPGLDAADE